MSNENNMTQSTYEEQFNKFTPQEFNNPMFGKLTVLKDSNGNLWFIGIEVASILGYKSPKDAVYDLVPSYYKQTVPINEFIGISPMNSPTRGNPNKTVISEHGLIALITKSTLTNSIIIEFQKWVYEIIVNMRKYGVAMSPQLKTVMEIDEQQLWEIAKQKEEENQQLKKKLASALNNIQDLQGELDYYKIMVSPDGLISSTAIGKDFGISGRVLNMILRKLNIIHKSSNGFELNQPFTEFGYCKKSNTRLPNGQITIYNYWTEYGRRFIYDLLKQQGLEIGSRNNEIVAKILAR